VANNTTSRKHFKIKQQLQRGVALRIMAETLWRLAKWSIRQPNCQPNGRVFGCRGASLAPQSRTLSKAMPRCNCHLLVLFPGFTLSCHEG